MSVDRNRADTLVFQIVCGWQVLKMQLICKKKKEERKKDLEKKFLKLRFLIHPFSKYEKFRAGAGSPVAFFFPYYQLNTCVLKVWL